MSIITVSTFTIPNWQYGGTTARLRIYPNTTFKTSDGKIIFQGSLSRRAWYRDVSCTVSGSLLTIPQFVIDSTTDSDNPNATYSAVLIDDKGAEREDFLPDMPEFRLSTIDGATVSWLQIRAYNQRAQRIPPQNWYETVNGIFNSLNSKLGGGSSSPNAGQVLSSASPGISEWTSQPTLAKIFLNTGGNAAPTTAKGTGSRLVYFDGGGVEHYSTGIEPGFLWNNVPAGNGYKFYFGANPAGAHSLNPNSLNFKTGAAVFAIDAQVGVPGEGGLRLLTNGDFFQFGTNNKIDWEVFKGTLLPKFDNLLSLGSDLMRVKNVFARRFKVSSGGASADILSGLGSPEGFVTASIGSVYLRMDGGVSTSLYVKESGTGVAGWKAVGSSTGGGGGGTSAEFNRDYLSPTLNATTETQTPPFVNQARAVRKISSTNAGQVLLQLGTESGADFYGFSLYRNGKSGSLVFEGNQPGTGGFEFNNDIEISTASKGLILTDVNGAKHRITVNTNGTLNITSAVTPVDKTPTATTTNFYTDSVSNFYIDVLGNFYTANNFTA